MKLATVEWCGRQIITVEEEETGKLIPIVEAGKAYGIVFPETMLELIAADDEVLQQVSQVVQQVKNADFLIAKEDVKWLAPIPRPTKNIFCVGKNYADHAIEMGSKADIPEQMIMFTKAPTTVIGHRERIPAHEDSTDQLDYEGELAVVIGKRARGVNREEAESYIFGYTIINDITARDLQERHKQYFIGKSLDGTCPMGPVIVHKSKFPMPFALDITTQVNGEARQQGNTEQLIFSIPEIIEVLSKGMTLEPGDVIATGTPAGVGKGFKPPKFLRDGDVIEITVEGIGTLCNQVVAEKV
ncbi:MAG: fumarylacetoacetate hydrolase family protein [Bacillus sp. (in: firmicutes)]